MKLRGGINGGERQRRERAGSFPNAEDAQRIARSGPHPCSSTRYALSLDKRGLRVRSETPSRTTALRHDRAQARRICVLLLSFAVGTAAPNTGLRTIARRGRCDACTMVRERRPRRRTAQFRNDQETLQHSVRCRAFPILPLVFTIAGRAGENPIRTEIARELSGIFARRAITPSCLRAHQPDVDHPTGMSTGRAHGA